MFFLFCMLCMGLGPLRTCANTVYTPSQEEVDKLSGILDLAVKGRYPGTSRTRPGKIPGRTNPIWNQRTTILYYHRRQAGRPIMWLTLAMGEIGNAKDIISNKKTWMGIWKETHPEEFTKMEKYIPKTWSDTDSFHSDMKEDSVYVYKPVLGHSGEGITFKTGYEMSKAMVDQEENGGPAQWVIQEFVDPFLFDNKKTHMRVLTLIIVQPDGSREYFIYHKMRLFTAAEDFDEERLVGGGDNSHMLITNTVHNKLFFESKPENRGKTFDSSTCLFDAETALGSSDSSLSFEYVYSRSKIMHNTIYSILGDLVECKATDVSIYDDSCFHIMASDVAFDREGNPFFLEMNNAMGYNIIWTDEEQSEFTRGVASLVRGTSSPYHVDDSSMWERLSV